MFQANMPLHKTMPQTMLTSEEAHFSKLARATAKSSHKNSHALDKHSPAKSSQTHQKTSPTPDSKAGAPKKSHLDRCIIEEHTRILADEAAADSAAVSSKKFSCSLRDTRMKKEARSHLSKLRHSQSDGSLYHQLAKSHTKTLRCMIVNVLVDV